MKKILTLAIISLLLASTFSVFNSQVTAEDASTLTQSFNEPILLREITIPNRARVVDYDDGIYAVGTSNGDLYVINESGEYTVTHLGDFMISDVRIKSPFIVVAANHIYDKGEYWYDTYHYCYASFDYGYVIKFTLSGLTPNEQWRTRIESWGYWSEGTWDGMSDTYQNFALPSVDLSSDGNYVAYLSHYDVGILRGSDGTPIASYSISGAYIVSWLDATDDMEYIAITAEVGPYYWGENTGVELYRFDGASLNRVWGTILIYRYETTEVKISEDKRYVAVATSSGTEMNLLDLATGSISWRYDATQEQFAVDGDRNLNYIIGATQYDPYVSPSPPYKWFIIHNLGTTFEVIAEGNMNGPINDLDSNDDASLLAFGSDAGEVILLRRTDNSIKAIYNFNVEKLIDSIEIGTNTFFVGGENFIQLYTLVEKVEEWSFAIITDLHIGWCYPDYGEQGYGDKGPGQDYWLTDRLKRIVEWINNNKGTYNIHFVVILGDIADTAEYSEFLKARDILASLNDPNGDGDITDGIPYIVVIGNHDVWPYTESGITSLFRDVRKPKDQHWEMSDYGDYYFNKVFWEENAKNIQKINELFGASWKKQFTEFHKLEETGQMALLQNYAWIFKGIKFIALDFVERKLDSSGPRVYSETKRWLTENLRGSEPIILFSHHSIGSDVSTYQVQEVGDAIRGGTRVLVNFAGHDHDNDEAEATWIYWDYSVSIKTVTTEAVCRESTWWHPRAATGNNIRIVTLLGNDIRDYKTFGNIHDETQRFKRRLFRSLSPVDLVISDPEGFVIDKEIGAVEGMFYVEFDVNDDGKLDDVVFLEELKIGDYHITVVPEANASLLDTYTLEFIEFDMIDTFTVTFAENVQICHIPTQPYIARSTGIEISSIIPARVDFDPDTFNLKSEGKWVTVYIELPLGHGYDVNMINLTSVILNGQVLAETKPTKIGDYDNDGIPDLMVKLNRALIRTILQVGDNVKITISGKLIDGRLFEGYDIIEVISPP